MLSEVPRYYASDAASGSGSGAARASAAASLPATRPLSELPLRVAGVVFTVSDVGEHDVIAARLRELGFVEGEPVKLVARGPFGGDPLLVQIGYTRFALRRAEAARVKVTQDAG